MTSIHQSITIALTWCLAWGDKRDPQYKLGLLQQMRQALKNEGEVPAQLQSYFQQVQQLNTVEFPQTIEELKQLSQTQLTLWNAKIGLVYGGATKIKQYVFESANLQDIRGASAILDRINLIDLPAFFGKPKRYISTNKWLNEHFPGLTEALIPELIIYSTGGNILAFCPGAFVDDLANAIERRYTEETLTANSCAVGDKFKLLEFRFGLLQDSIEETKWLDWYLPEEVRVHPLVEAYFGRKEEEQNWEDLFKSRKNFNELAGKLATLFNHRRNGNDRIETERPSRRYPPMLETHPYLKRDRDEYRVAVTHLTDFPQEPWLSEASARKLLMGQITKREDTREKLAKLYGNQNLTWKPRKIESWVNKFEQFVQKSKYHNEYYQSISDPKQVQEARSLKEIGNASKGFVAYIYADGNNMGGYIQKHLQNPEDYQEFSRDIFQATEESVYQALAQHIKPHELRDLTGEEAENRNGKMIHPFEILTIGGDDVLLIVPANKALQIAKTIGDEFEKYLAKKERYKLPPNPDSLQCHRYLGETAPADKCQLSMSAGVLICADDTPVYYAEKLTSQLLKSAKKTAKQLKKEYGYHGGTVDFLTLKSVTMVSSNIEAFREEAFIKKPSGNTKLKRSSMTRWCTKCSSTIKKPSGNTKLKLYGTPYTLHELGGLIETAKAFKVSKFPRSQLYQIRSFLEQGKHTAILNYRYFRVRLKEDKQKLLEDNFEMAWCEAKTNNGNLAPWMLNYITLWTKLILIIAIKLLPIQIIQLKYNWLKIIQKSTYETIWRELVDLYPFIDIEEAEPSDRDSVEEEARS